MASWKIKRQQCHFQKQRCPYARPQMPGTRRQQSNPKATLVLAIGWAHRRLESSLHSLARERLCHSSPPRQSYRDEIISLIFFIFLNHHLNSRKCVASCCQESCHHGKEKEKVPQIGVESLPRTVNIFGSPQRTNVCLNLAGSAVLKRLTPGWLMVASQCHVRWVTSKIVGSLESEQNASSIG